MTKTKRQKNAIIINFSIIIVLFIASIISTLVYIIPWFKEVEWLKEQAQKVYDDYKTIQKEGQSFNDFKAVISSSASNSSNTYTQKILEDIDAEFYNMHLKNTEYKSYEDFISNITDKYSDTTEFDEKIKKLWKILPSYSEQISDFGDDFLTDFKFINYIESLANTFNINFRNSIGIKEVTLVDGYSTSTSDSSLETNIYYIPLDLDISWRKESILDFIYFIQRVGKIQEHETEEWIFDITFVQWVDKNFNNLAVKAISWQERVQWYDLFNNQISDIEFIEIPKYPDSSYDLNNNYSDMLGFIKNTQWNEVVDVKLGLRFYVKGLPIYKIEENILKFIEQHWKLKGLLGQKIWDPNTPSNTKKIAESRLRTLIQLETTVIPKIRESLVTKDSIDEAYKDSFKYLETFERYANEVWLTLVEEEEQEVEETQE